jgi:hypothetical protein
MSQAHSVKRVPTLLELKFTYSHGSGVLFQAQIRGFVYLWFLDHRLMNGVGGGKWRRLRVCLIMS